MVQLLYSLEFLNRVKVLGMSDAWEDIDVEVTPEALELVHLPEPAGDEHGAASGTKATLGSTENDSASALKVFATNGTI